MRRVTTLLTAAVTVFVIAVAGTVGSARQQRPLEDVVRDVVSRIDTLERLNTRGTSTTPTDRSPIWDRSSRRAGSGSGLPGPSRTRMTSSSVMAGSMSSTCGAPRRSSARPAGETEAPDA